MYYGKSSTYPQHIYTTTGGREAQGDWIILTAPHTVCTLCNTHTSDFSEKNRLVSASGAISDIRQLGVAKQQEDIKLLCFMKEAKFGYL